MKKLLIVDDEEGMRGLYRRRLSSTYQVFETGNPEEALALAMEHKPDAIFLDLKMPKYDGFELCRNFRALNPTAELPIFVVTGQSGDYRKECEAIGITGYFEKPIDFNRLKEALTTALSAAPARPKSAELRMKVAVQLEGTDASGQAFSELAETETINADGFTCVTGRDLAEKSCLNVRLTQPVEKYVGRARIVGRSSAGLERFRYEFSFEGEKAAWVVQGK